MQHFELRAFSATALTIIGFKNLRDSVLQGRRAAVFPKLRRRFGCDCLTTAAGAPPRTRPHIHGRQTLAGTGGPALRDQALTSLACILIAGAARLNGWHAPCLSQNARVDIFKMAGRMGPVKTATGGLTSLFPQWCQTRQIA